MKGKKKVTIGALILLVGFAQFIAVALFTSDRPELRILSPISSGILGACFVAGIGMIQRGRDPKIEKQKQIAPQEANHSLCIYIASL